MFMDYGVLLTTESFTAPEMSMESTFSIRILGVNLTRQHTFNTDKTAVQTFTAVCSSLTAFKIYLKRSLSVNFVNYMVISD